MFFYDLWKLLKGHSDKKNLLRNITRLKRIKSSLKSYQRPTKPWSKKVELSIRIYPRNQSYFRKYVNQISKKTIIR